MEDSVCVARNNAGLSTRLGLNRRGGRGSRIGRNRRIGRRGGRNRHRGGVGHVRPGLRRRVLDPEGEDPDPVLTWVSATGARPTLQALPEDLRADFTREFGAALRTAYPRTDAGVVLPFRRVFAVATRHDDAG